MKLFQTAGLALLLSGVVLPGPVLLGCSMESAPARDAELPSPARTTAVSTPTPDTLVVTEDPELRAMAERLLPGLAERSGLDLREPVRIERRSRSDLESFLRAKLDEELDSTREAALVDAYTLFGLLPAEFEMRGTLLSVYQEQVAGFYDPDSTTLYVLDDQPRDQLESLLLHELVHAVQDQWVDLDAVTAVELGNDRRTAAQAAIEGHATLVMLEFMVSQVGPGGVDLMEIPNFRELFGPALEGVRAQYPALGSAPRIIQESLLLPYLEGAGFVQGVWRERGSREAPFDALLPASTEQVADPARFLSNPPDAPTRVELRPAEPFSGELFEGDVLGFAETRILLEEIAGAGAGEAATGWDGDRWLLLRAGEAADGAGGSALIWAAVWDDVDARDRFIEVLTPHLGAFPGATGLTARSHDNRPMSLLRIGELAVDLKVEIGLDGGEVGRLP